MLVTPGARLILDELCHTSDCYKKCLRHYSPNRESGTGTRKVGLINWRLHRIRPMTLRMHLADQRRARRRPPGTRRVLLHGSSATSSAHAAQNRRDKRPLRFHFVVARKQRRVAQHGVHQQTLVRVVDALPERAAVGESPNPPAARASAAPAASPRGAS